MGMRSWTGPGAVCLLALGTMVAAGCSGGGKAAGGDTGASSGGGDGGDGSGDGGDGGGETGDDGGVTPPEEECNGIDDDGDGEVDEGFPDTDGDGVADCLDTECTVDEAAAGEVPVDDTCTAPANVVSDPWDVGIEWQWSSWSGNPDLAQVIAVPVVGNLVDTNADSVVDERDTPNIVVVAFSYSDSSSRLVVLDGASGAEQWAVGGVSPYGGIALADVDGDGWTDVLAVDNSGRPVAYRGDGSLLWQSTAAISTSYYSYPQVAVADLDADGVPEVLVQEIVVDGATGALELSGLGPSSSVPYWIPTAADLDQDGDQELIHGDRVYDSNGNLLWQAPFSGTYGHWAAVLDYDGDPEAEIAMIGGGYLGIYEADGTERVRTALGASQPGAPCVADFDGDGAPEIGVAGRSNYTVFDTDGTKLWERVTQDASSGNTGSAVFDFEGDGVADVVYADETRLWVFDGVSGTVKLESTEHSNGTWTEYSIIADVDADGQAEIVVPNTSSHLGFYVFGDADNSWQEGRRIWNQHAYHITNVNDDGTIPTNPDLNWLTYNNFRSGDVTAGQDGEYADLLVEVPRVCLDDCDEGTLVVYVQVGNKGYLDAEGGTTVVLYGELDDGTEVELARQDVTTSILSGTVEDAIRFDIGVSAFNPVRVWATVDGGNDAEDGAYDECDETNNEAIWLENLCIET
jgi:hypothetical protein